MSVTEGTALAYKGDGFFPDKQHQLVKLCLAVLEERVLSRPELQQAVAAAKVLTEGVVITGDEEAVLVNDQVAQVARGEKFLRAAQEEILAAPKGMEAAIRNAVRSRTDLFTKAKKLAGDAQVAWKRERERLAREAYEAEQRRIAAEHAKDVEEAEALGLEAAPPPLPWVEEAPRKVEGGAGETRFTSDLKCLLLDRAAAFRVHPDWFTFTESAAKAWFRDEVETKKMRDEHGRQRQEETKLPVDNKVVRDGVQFWRETRAVQVNK